jgi:hypothetical protein
MAVEQVRLGNNQKALLALRKKKYQEQLLEQSGNQLLNLEQLVRISLCDDRYPQSNFLRLKNRSLRVCERVVKC